MPCTSLAASRRMSNCRDSCQDYRNFVRGAGDIGVEVALDCTQRYVSLHPHGCEHYGAIFYGTRVVVSTMDQFSMVSAWL